MNSLIVQVNDSTKIKLIKDLLEQFDFIEVIDEEIETNELNSSNLLDYKGLWSDYQVDADKLRKSAWKQI